MDTATKTAKYLSIIILVAAFLGGGFLLNKRFKSDKSGFSIQNLIQSQQEAGQEKNPDGVDGGQLGNMEDATALDPQSVLGRRMQLVANQSSNPKTYRNDAFGFELTYPGNWSQIGQGDVLTLRIMLSGPDKLGQMADFAVKNKDNTAMGPNEDIIVNASKNNEKNLSTFVAEHKYASEPTRLKFAGTDAFEVSVAGDNPSYTVVVANKTNVIEIIFPGKATRDDLTEEEKKILESFKLSK